MRIKTFEPEQKENKRNDWNIASFKKGLESFYKYNARKGNTNLSSLLNIKIGLALKIYI